jgi:hypothetical protein
MLLDQRLGLGDISLRTGRQEELDRVAQGSNRNLGAEPASGTAEGLSIWLPFFPAAC